MDQPKTTSADGRSERQEAPLATLVYRAGLLSAERLEIALSEGDRTGRRLGEVLLQRGWIHESDLARLLAGQKGLPFVSIDGRGYDAEAARLLPEATCRVHAAMPIENRNGAVLVAVADPTDEAALAEVRAGLSSKAQFVVATRSEITATLDAVFNGDVGHAGSREATRPSPLAPGEPGPQPAALVRPAAAPPASPRAGDGRERASDSVAARAAPAPSSVDGAPAFPADGDHETDQRFRVVVSLEGGEALNVAVFGDENAAEMLARKLVESLANGEWPRIGRRYVRPAGIVSVEIQEQKRFVGSSGRAGWGASARDEGDADSAPPIRS